MTALLCILVTLALGYGAYRIVRNGLRFPQSERLGVFGIFGCVILIALGVWLATAAVDRFF